MEKIFFNEDDFTIIDKAMNGFPQIIKYSSGEVSLPSSYNASFNASILRRRDTPQSPWVYIPSVKMTFFYDYGAEDSDVSDSIGKAASMEDAVKLIKRYVVSELNKPHENKYADFDGYVERDSSGSAYDWDIDTLSS